MEGRGGSIEDLLLCVVQGAIKYPSPITIYNDHAIYVLSTRGRSGEALGETEVFEMYNHRDSMIYFKRDLGREEPLSSQACQAT